MALVTFTITVQLVLGAIWPPLSEMLVPPATAVTVPLVQVVVALRGVATTRLVGRLSVNASPV